MSLIEKCKDSTTADTSKARVHDGSRQPTGASRPDQAAICSPAFGMLPLAALPVLSVTRGCSGRCVEGTAAQFLAWMENGSNADSVTTEYIRSLNSLALLIVIARNDTSLMRLSDAVSDYAASVSQNTLPLVRRYADIAMIHNHVTLVLTCHLADGIRQKASQPAEYTSTILSMAEFI